MDFVPGPALNQALNQGAGLIQVKKGAPEGWAWGGRLQISRRNGWVE